MTESTGHVSGMMGSRVLYVDEDAVRRDARRLDVRGVAVMCGMFARYGNMRFADDRGYYAKEKALRAIVSMQNDMGDIFANNMYVSDHAVMMLAYRPEGLHDGMCVYSVGIDLILDEKVRYTVERIGCRGDDLVIHAAGLRLLLEVEGIGEALEEAEALAATMRLTHGDWVPNRINQPTEGTYRAV